MSKVDFAMHTIQIHTQKAQAVQCSKYNQYPIIIKMPNIDAIASNINKPVPINLSLSI